MTEKEFRQPEHKLPDILVSYVRTPDDYKRPSGGLYPIQYVEQLFGYIKDLERRVKKLERRK